MSIPTYSGGYIDRANNNINIYEETHAGEHLIYAALEYRCAIERLVFDYLGLIDTNGQKDEEKLYRIVEMRGRILKLEPDFHLKIDFVNLYLRAMDWPHQFSKPDLDLLNSLYGQLGRFLHAINKPKDTIKNQKWWDRLVQLLSEVRETMAPLSKVPRVHYKLNEAGWKLFGEFKKKTKTEAEIMRIFQISLKAVKA